MSALSVLRVRYAGILFVTSLLCSGVNLSAQKAASRIPDVIDEENLVTLKGNVPAQARPEDDRGEAQGNLPLNRIVLLLKRSDVQEQALRRSIQAMHDPNSPEYHKWLTPKQVGTLYGPSDTDIAKLSGWLARHGLKVDNVAKGRGTIEISGTADAVASAFHTRIHNYLVRGEQHYANAADPQIPAALTPVVAGVLSLHNFVKQPKARILGTAQFDPARARAATKENGAQPSKDQLVYTPAGSNPAFTSGGSNYVGPGDLWTIYNAAPLITATSSVVNGTGVTIAIVGRSDIDINDITGFRSTLLPAPYASMLPFQQIVNGPDPGIVSGDDLEQTLDVEYSSALAPGAQIDLVVSGSTNSTDGVDLSAAYIVDNNLASVMSTSYGLCEALLGTAANAFYNSLWEQAAAQGITAMVSSGDNGSAGCDVVGPSGSDTFAYVADEGLQVNGLASTPFNIAVGGNEFTNDTSAYWNQANTSSPAPFTSALSYVPEQVWNESCSPLVCGDAGAEIAAGSGGASGCFTPTLDSAGNIIACSGGYPAPDWQSGVIGLLSDNKRHVPDVSLTAAGHDGYMVCYLESCSFGGFYVVGGTSASSPSFAGIMALVNQKTGARQGQADYTLYRLASAQFGTPDAPISSQLSACNASNGNTSDSSCIFHDVTSGTNAVPCDGGTLNCSTTTKGSFGVLTGFTAGTGYDSATGLGSVNVANLVNHWNDVTAAPTTTTLALGSVTSTFGSPFPITVTVKPQSGSGVPTGAAALITDSTVLDAVGGGVVTLTNGIYSGMVNSLPGGTYHVSARYSGDSSFASSTSSGTQVTIAPASSKVNLAIAAFDAITRAPITRGQIPYGSIVTATAALLGVSGQAAPNGPVTFLSGNATLASIASAPDGTASYSSTGLGIGSYSWSASYGGNNNYTASSSPAVPFTISKAATVLKLAANTSYVVGSGNVVLTAHVVTDSLLLNPTGSITFFINGKTVGVVSVAAYADSATGASEAQAAFTAPASLLVAGANSVTAAYSGDADYSGSSSPTLSIGYSATTPVNRIRLVSSDEEARVGQPVRLTANVATGGIPATAGTVQFFEEKGHGNSRTLSLVGTAQVAGSTAAAGHTTGTATLTMLLAPGQHAFTAVYDGIVAAPAVVTSEVVRIEVEGRLPSTTALTEVPDSLNSANYDLTAVVSGMGFAPPAGRVVFAETSLPDNLGKAPVDAGHASHGFLAPAYSTAGDPAGAAPAQSVVADFNGDGIPDMATANASFSEGTMSVLLGNGDGTFKSPTTYATGIFADAIVAGDFNNDGVLDLAVTSQYNSSFTSGLVSIFLGNGDGTFKQQIPVNISGYPISTVVGDFNRDGVLDIATVQYYPMQFSVAFGNGDGTFQTPTNYPIASSDFSPYAMASGDFNGDGATDIVEANASDNTLGVFLNNGDGTFSVKNYVTAGNPEWITVADVNGDGKQDLLVADYGDQKLQVLLGNGDGTFQNPLSTTLNGYTSSLAVADVDGDGKLDVALGIFYPALGVGIVKGNGDGTFGPETDYPTNQGHGYAVTLADLNGDGTPDLISADINAYDSAPNSLAILLNVTQATAKVANVAVAGPAGTQEQVQASYSGDEQYKSSSSPGLAVSGSGTPATTFNSPAQAGALAPTPAVGGPHLTNDTGAPHSPTAQSTGRQAGNLR